MNTSIAPIRQSPQRRYSHNAISISVTSIMLTWRLFLFRSEVAPRSDRRAGGRGGRRC